MTVLKDFTLIDAKTDASLILTLDDPDLFKHPIVTMWEPGFWVMTDEEAERLRASQVVVLGEQRGATEVEILPNDRFEKVAALAKLHCDTDVRPTRCSSRFPGGRCR